MGKNSNRKLFQVISAFLALSIMATCLPNGSFASPSGDSSLQENLNVSPFIVKEDETQRTEFSKTFLRSDGMNVLISATQSLHYIDKETNKWSDIDNTLVSDKDSNGKDVLVNRDNAFKVSLPAEIDGNSYVTAEKEGYKLSFKMAGTSNSRTDKINKVDQITAEEKAGTVEDEIVIQKASDIDKKTAIEMTNMSDKSDTVKYDAVEQDTSVNYNLQPNSLKETITLNKMPNKAINYVYDIKTTGLTAELQKDNSVNFYSLKDKSKTPVFVMPAPFMYDSKNVNSSDIITIIKSVGSGYELTYSPSVVWLSATERVYPVTIDPTVTAANGVNTTYNDAYVIEGDNTCYGATNQNPSCLYVGKGSSGQVYRTYVKVILFRYLIIAV